MNELAAQCRYEPGRAVVFSLPRNQALQMRAKLA